MNPEEAPIKNLIDFAIEEATLRIDNEKNPVIDRNRLKSVLLEIITKREKRLHRLLKAEKWIKYPFICDLITKTHIKFVKLKP